MTPERIASLALEVAKKVDYYFHLKHQPEIRHFAVEFLARVREEESNDAVAWQYTTPSGQVGLLRDKFEVVGHTYQPLFLHPQGDQWISVEDRLPDRETPVLIKFDGKEVIGVIRWEYPSFEDTFEAYWYWDNPTDDGQDWERELVTHWMPLSKSPAAKEEA